MKSLFRCEKCGRISENPDEIMECESHHYTVNRPYCDIEGLNATLDSQTEYKEGQEEPNVVHIMFERSYWNGEEWKDEKRIGKYKLISSYQAPLVIENE